MAHVNSHFIGQVDGSVYAGNRGCCCNGWNCNVPLEWTKEANRKVSTVNTELSDSWYEKRAFISLTLLISFPLI